MNDTFSQVRDKLAREIGNFGNQKKIIIPNTVVLEAIKENESQNILYTCFEHERCEKLTGYDSINNKVDTKRIIDREIGECSIVVDLSNIANVFISESLYKAINKESVIVAYATGNKNFLCSIGKHFLKEYNLMKELIIQK